MKTLLEFITLTKGVEYLIAIAFLFGFVAFWYLALHKSDRGLILRIIPVMVLALGFGGLAYTSATHESTSATPLVTDETPFLNSPVLVEMYGPAPFNHELHQGITQDCTMCHHYSEAKTPPCKECHDAPFKPGNLNLPGIAHVYHLRCISCHTENRAGPTECTECHNKAAIPPLSIAHPVAGAENCLSCHNNGVSGVLELPADHANATNGVCQLCHKS